LTWSCGSCSSIAVLSKSTPGRGGRILSSASS